MKNINFLDVRRRLKKDGLTITLFYLDNLHKKKDISRQQHRVLQNWVSSICQSRKYK